MALTIGAGPLDKAEVCFLPRYDCHLRLGNVGELGLVRRDASVVVKMEEELLMERILLDMK